MKATKGGTFNPVPLPDPTTAIARCYSVVDLGTVPNVYKGVVSPDKPTIRKIYITWEFPTLLAIFNEDKGEEPFVIGMELTASTGEKSNLSKLVSQWRNKPLTIQEQDGFDPSTMIGKLAYISFIHKRKPKFQGQEITKITNENTNLKFNGIMPKPKEIASPPNRNPYMNWDWDKVAEEGFEKHKETFEKIPKWLQQKMSESEEFRKYAGSYKIAGSDAADDDSAEETTAQKGPVPTVSDDNW